MRSTHASPFASVAIALASCLVAACSPARKPAAKHATTDDEKVYLASITIPLNGAERVESFTFDTWGVTFIAVCQIPPGWRITVGRSASFDGVIAGQGSHGVTWLDANDQKALDGLVLVSLYEPVRARDEANYPATFKGEAQLETPDTDRKVPLTSANVRLTPATRCPERKP